MGKIIDNPIDYYTDRVPKKQQKQTILEELIEDSKVRKYVCKIDFSDDSHMHFLFFWLNIKIYKEALLVSKSQRRKEKKSTFENNET